MFLILGIISYTEYLFLLSILTSKCLHGHLYKYRKQILIIFMFTEPKSGFHIAFNMFDTDGNQRVDKNEFLVVSMSPFRYSLTAIPLLRM